MSINSLFQCCLKFIVNNIIHVESLIHFPESIGKQIFFGSFKANTLTPDSIKTFTEAYGVELLHSFKCHNLLFLNKYSDAGLCDFLLCVTHLDLSNCDLGKDPDNDCMRTLGFIVNLKVLNISNNSLGVNRHNSSFRWMLLGHRKYDKGFLNLEVLDLSFNFVNVKIFNFFLGLPKLNKMKVSISNSLKESDKLFMIDWNKTVARNSFVIINTKILIETEEIQSKGWAVALITKWERDIGIKEKLCENKPKNGENNPFNHSNLNNFYTKKKDICYNHKESFNLKKQSIKSDFLDHFIYIRNNLIKENTSRNVSICTTGSKRMLTDLADKENNKRKRFCQRIHKEENISIMDDLDLLKLYINK